MDTILLFGVLLLGLAMQAEWLEAKPPSQKPARIRKKKRITSVVTLNNVQILQHLFSKSAIAIRQI